MQTPWSIGGAGRRWARAGMVSAGLAMAVAALALGLAWVWQPTGARAASVLALDLEGLVARADVIATGRVQHTQARRAAQGKLIVTDVAFRVLRPLKGGIAVGDDLVITTLGGKLDNLALTVPGEATFQVGETSLVFLRRTRDGELRVVGMAQGRMTVEGRGAAATVTPQHGHLMRLPAAPGPDRTAGDVGKQDPTPPPAPRPLADVLADITRLVQGEPTR